MVGGRAWLLRITTTTDSKNGLTAASAPKTARKGDDVAKTL